MSNLGTAFLEYEEVHRQRVLENTWGHLAPEPRQTYSGTMLFAHGEYGHLVPLRVAFENLPDSPWFFEDMNEFIGEKLMEREPGGIFQFTGRYTKFKNGKYRFSGKIVEMDCIPAKRKIST